MLRTESKSSFNCWYTVNFINSAFEVVSGEVEADKDDSSSSSSEKGVMKLLSLTSRPIKQVHVSK